jgi:hypothetical protein
MLVTLELLPLLHAIALPILVLEWYVLDLGAEQGHIFVVI